MLMTSVCLDFHHPFWFRVKRSENNMDSIVSNCGDAGTVSTKTYQGITGIRYNTTVTKKWMTIFLIFIMFFPQATNVYSFERCRTDACPTHGEYCHNSLTYKTGCNETHPLTCGEDQTGTVRMFCHEPHLCQTLGTYNSVLHVDGKNSLECKECPAGTFLSYLSKSPKDMNCVNHEHPHGREMLKFILAKNGTSSMEAVYSCNYKEGYISVNKQMYCQPYNLCTCAHVGEIHTSCDQDILPDWSCSVKCEPGSKRDPLNNYSCSSIGNETVKPTGTSKSVTMSQTNETTKATTTSTVNPVARTDTTSDNNNTFEIVIAVVFPLTVIVIAIVCICRKKSPCYCCLVSSINTPALKIKKSKYTSVRQVDNLCIGDQEQSVISEP